MTVVSNVAEAVKTCKICSFGYLHIPDNCIFFSDIVGMQITEIICTRLLTENMLGKHNGN